MQFSHLLFVNRVHQACFQEIACPLEDMLLIASLQKADTRTENMRRYLETEQFTELQHFLCAPECSFLYCVHSPRSHEGHNVKGEKKKKKMDTKTDDKEKASMWAAG